MASTEKAQGCISSPESLCAELAQKSRSGLKALLGMEQRILELHQELHSSLSSSSVNHHLQWKIIPHVLLGLLLDQSPDD